MGPVTPVPKDLTTQLAFLQIDGSAGTFMYHNGGTPESLEFLRYDLVNLAYNLSGLRRAAIIGVGGGRDLLSAHAYGVPEITGVELNPIFIDLLTEHQDYASYSNLGSLPNLKLYVDDARSWFASTDRAIRHRADEHDRHLGGNRCGGLQPERKRALHAGRLACLHAEARRRRDLHREPLVQPGRRE